MGKRLAAKLRKSSPTASAKCTRPSQNLSGCGRWGGISISTRFWARERLKASAGKSNTTGFRRYGFEASALRYGGVTFPARFRAVLPLVQSCTLPNLRSTPNFTPSE